ncbi:hypothetical protein MUN89_12840 [Halobacillus salinarum]|uniref:Uncharacterized protein n=1 Tax=Halobacillus salinarum TaxID=2932257 RepID=A0ABY4EEE9_9BACI|nr:hypothetical protein [Halobacillus salinarum]UOQ42848.1 hypothetical protein MUN89_12840 [Halobacillus salinarum]
MVRKIPLSLALALAFAFSYSGIVKAAYSNYENVILSENDKVVYTDPIYVTEGKIEYYVKNNTGASVVPRILSWSITDGDGNVVAEGRIAPTEDPPGERVDEGTVYVSNYETYTLNLTGYVNVDGYGSLYTPPS